MALGVSPLLCDLYVLCKCCVDRLGMSLWHWSINEVTDVERVHTNQGRLGVSTKYPQSTVISHVEGSVVDEKDAFAREFMEEVGV